jgi:hypothetical protein
MSPFLRPKPDKKQGDCEGELRGKIARPSGYCFSSSCMAGFF